MPIFRVGGDRHGEFLILEPGAARAGATGREFRLLDMANQQKRRLLCIGVVVLLATLIIAAEAQAIPAADIPTQCNSIERCCMPTPYRGTPGIRQYSHDEPGSLPRRTRRPVHLLTKSETTRLEKAYELLRALPDSDPRSLINQNNLHCLYCDNALYYPGQKYPLEIHNGWFFLPWHRMYLYWHERILAKLLDDETFSLPYWAWDNAQKTEPLANTLPLAYANKTSSLWDVNRNNCSEPPFLVDLDTRGGGCTRKTAEFLRVQNDRLMYSQLVIGAPTPALFFGLPYRFGDWGGLGGGNLEDQPHGTVHAWVGNLYAKPPLMPRDDMGNLGRTALDPVFYAHHTNIDRMWWLWNKFPGGNRTFPMDPDFNASEFTFYDENANLVKMNVSQVLDHEPFKYTYEEFATPWVTNGVSEGEENSIALCNPLSKTAVNALIANSTKHKTSQVVGISEATTFKIKRPKRSDVGTEVLEFSGIRIHNNSDQAHWKAYLFYPQVQASQGAECPEYAGTFDFLPHVGQSKFNPKRVWRVALGPKLQQIGKDYVDTVVVSVVQTSKPPGQKLTFSRVRAFYDVSPAVSY